MIGIHDLLCQIHTGKRTTSRDTIRPCGHVRPEDTSKWPDGMTSTRFWRCEGGIEVLRGDGNGYSDGPMFINSRRCPNCGWMADPWSRVFAPATCDGTADQCIEWLPDQREVMDDIRGGGGDELEYDTRTDMFRFNLGSGPGPMCYVTNPRPGEPLEGAKIVYRMADTTWE